MDSFLWFVWPPPKGRSRCNRKTRSRILRRKAAVSKGSAGQYTQRHRRCWRDRREALHRCCRL